MKLEIR